MRNRLAKFLLGFTADDYDRVNREAADLRVELSATKKHVELVERELTEAKERVITAQQEEIGMLKHLYDAEQATNARTPPFKIHHLPPPTFDAEELGAMMHSAESRSAEKRNFRRAYDLKPHSAWGEPLSPEEAEQRLKTNGQPEGAT